MKLIRKATEDEMLLSFMQGELKSERFSGELRAAVAKCGQTEEIVTNGDLDSADECMIRKTIMSEFRGYSDSEIFTDYPRNAAWYYVCFEIHDIEKIRYISYSYWDELSNGTSSPLAAAETIRKGIRIFDVPNDNFWNASAYLQAGNSFDPVILIAKNDTYTVLEGHVRMTAYAMNPELFDHTYGYVGFTEACRL